MLRRVFEVLSGVVGFEEEEEEEDEVEEEELVVVMMVVVEVGVEVGVERAGACVEVWCCAAEKTLKRVLSRVTAACKEEGEEEGDVFDTAS